MYYVPLFKGKVPNDKLLLEAYSTLKHDPCSSKLTVFKQQFWYTIFYSQYTYCMSVPTHLLCPASFHSLIFL